MAPLAPPASSNRVKATRIADPDEYRMTFGEHLDELRTRLFLGLGGFFVAFIACLTVVKDWVFQFLTKPMLDVMYKYELNPMLYDSGAGGAFTVYLKLSAIAAVVLAGPWLLYQIWMFIASGLYPHERKTVTKFIPLSVALLLGGVAFAFYIVLPMTLQFFIWFTTTIKVPSSYEPVAQAEHVVLPTIPMMKGDPIDPPNGSMWFNESQFRLKMNVGGHTRIIQYTSENLVSPFITLTDYTDMLLMMLLVFGLSFQMPLVVIVLVRIGIFELEEMKAMRKIVYFVIVVLAAVITPGDVVTATIALMLPLCGLFELGLILAKEPEKIDAGSASTPS